MQSINALLYLFLEEKICLLPALVCDGFRKGPRYVASSAPRYYYFDIFTKYCRLYEPGECNKYNFSDKDECENICRSKYPDFAHYYIDWETEELWEEKDHIYDEYYKRMNEYLKLLNALEPEKPLRIASGKEITCKSKEEILQKIRGNVDKKAFDVEMLSIGILSITFTKKFEIIVI